jgi:hypothetical protein
MSKHSYHHLKGTGAFHFRVRNAIMDYTEILNKISPTTVEQPRRLELSNTAITANPRSS